MDDGRTDIRESLLDILLINHTVWTYTCYTGLQRLNQCSMLQCGTGGALFKNMPLILLVNGFRNVPDFCGSSWIRYIHGSIYFLLSTHVQASTIYQLYITYYQRLKRWGLKLVPQARWGCLSVTTSLRYHKTHNIDEMNLVPSLQRQIHNILQTRHFCRRPNLCSASRSFTTFSSDGIIRRGRIRCQVKDRTDTSMSVDWFSTVDQPGHKYMLISTTIPC